MLNLKRGFAAMPAEQQRRIASNGGKRAHALGRAHHFSSNEARVAGRLGGQTISADRLHMAAIGRKGGLAVSRDRAHMAALGRLSGKKISTNRKHMAAIGKKGGGQSKPMTEPPHDHS